MPNIKINPNLTKRRGKILYDAVKLTEELPKLNFIFSYTHGDLKIGVNEPQDGKYVFPFESARLLDYRLCNLI